MAKSKKNNSKKPKKKRGRKPKKKKYFGPEQEQAVVDFLASDNQLERTRIYNKYLKEPLNKMVESIIRRYELYSDKETFEHWHNDALSFLIHKSDKFDASKGKKAYSYYGTIVRNYITGRLIKEGKKKKRDYSYEDVFGTVQKRDDMMYNLDISDYSMSDFVQDISDKIEVEMENADNENMKNVKKLTKNERKVGHALIDILSNWELHFDMANNKYNKNQFLQTVRNYTNLTTKDIRNAMRRYKSLYKLFKRSQLDQGYL